tara:strand:- start:1764 stop:2768 length:1005 start_codon:yes stop_codon:yes gene_type:complete
MKKNILTIFISVIFSIFLLELAFKLFYPQELNTPLFTTDNDGLVLNNKNDKAYHSFSKINVEYNFGKFHNREYGFDKNKERILILGDSFTFGWLLKDEETFVFKLNNKFNNYYFINSATGGWGISDQLSYLTKFCKLIKPEKVIIIINNGDLIRSYNSNLFYLNEQNELISGKNEVNELSKLTENFLYKFLVRNFDSVRFLKKLYVNFFINKNNKNKLTHDSAKAFDKINENYSLPKKLYLAIDKEVKKCQSDLILINLAWRSIETDENLFFYRDNKNFFSKNDISFIDLNNEMNIIHTNKKDFEIKGDGHPNAKANQIFFDVISNKLEKNFNF